MTFDCNSLPERVPGAGEQFHCHGRSGRLDPRRLSRAVEHLLLGRPDLGRAAGALSRDEEALGPFTHLDLARVARVERSRTAETICWVLGRCLESGRTASPLLVAYLDPGEQETGHLLVVGRRPAVADAAACAALSEALLTLYRETGPG